MAAYFLANRLLPLGIAGRSDQEIDTMFIAWGGVAIWALARPARRAWLETLSATTLAFAAVPVVNTLTTHRSLFTPLPAADAVFASFAGALPGIPPASALAGL